MQPGEWQAAKIIPGDGMAQIAAAAGAEKEEVRGLVVSAQHADDERYCVSDPSSDPSSDRESDPSNDP